MCLTRPARTEDNAFTRDNTDDGNGWWTRLTHHIEGGYSGYPYDYRKAVNYGVVRPSPQTLDAIVQHGGNVGGSSQSRAGEGGGAGEAGLGSPAYFAKKYLGFEQVMLETTGGETIAGSLRAERAGVSRSWMPRGNRARCKRRR